MERLQWDYRTGRIDVSPKCLVIRLPINGEIGWDLQDICSKSTASAGLTGKVWEHLGMDGDMGCPHPVLG